MKAFVQSYGGRVTVSFTPAFRGYSALLAGWAAREARTGALPGALVGAVARMLPVLGALHAFVAPQRTQLPSDYACLFRRRDVVRVVYRRQYGVDVYARPGFVVLSGFGPSVANTQGQQQQMQQQQRRLRTGSAVVALPEGFFAQAQLSRVLAGGRRVLVAEARGLGALLHDAQRWACQAYALRMLPAVLAAEVREAAGARAPVPVQVRGDALQYAWAGAQRHVRVDGARAVLQVQDVPVGRTSAVAPMPGVAPGVTVAVPLEHFVLFPLRAAALRLVARTALLPLRVAAELVAVARLVRQQQLQLQQPPPRPRAAVVWCHDAAQAPAALRPHYAPCALALAPDALDVLLVVVSRETGHETQLFLPLRYSYAQERRPGLAGGGGNSVSGDVALIESLVPPPTLDQCRAVVAHARAAAAAAAAASAPAPAAAPAPVQQAPTGALQVFVAALIAAMSDSAFLQSLVPSLPR